VTNHPWVGAEGLNINYFILVDYFELNGNKFILRFKLFLSVILLIFTNLVVQIVTTKNCNCQHVITKHKNAVTINL